MSWYQKFYFNLNFIKFLQTLILSIILYIYFDFNKKIYCTSTSIEKLSKVILDNGSIIYTNNLSLNRIKFSVEYFNFLLDKSSNNIKFGKIINPSVFNKKSCFNHPSVFMHCNYEQLSFFNYYTTHTVNCRNFDFVNNYIDGKDHLMNQFRSSELTIVNTTDLFVKQINQNLLFNINNNVNYEEEINFFINLLRKLKN